jgi:energy-coupling factor transporter ATP-binding protein EcfA2
VYNEQLAELLGQNSIAAQLVADLATDDVRLVRLTGPAGSGKSEIARDVAALWRSSGERCVVAVGDDEHSWRELYPLLSGLSRAHRDWVGLASTGTRSALRVADSAAGAVGVATSIFDLLTAAFRQQTERALKPYAALERDVVLDLKRLARGHRLLLIADNGHWWDAYSLRLLADLLSDSLRETIPQLCSVVVLFVDSAGEEPIVATDAFNALVSRYVQHTLHTSRCTREQFPQVLKAFGVGDELPQTVVGELFAVTHGHLKLVEQIAAYETQSIPDAPTAQIDAEYLAALFKERFESLGSSSPEVTDLLVRAAVLGLTCTEQDLQCIAEKRRGDVRALLERAERIGFVERAAEQVTFCHDVIRAGLLTEQPSSTLEGLYLKLAECLSILRPGDYAARAQALLQGGAKRQAREMVALAGVSQIRRGVPIVRVLTRAEIQAPEDQELTAYLQLIASGYQAVASGGFGSVLPGLGTPLPSETTVMAAERNYLAAICALGSQTRAGADQARKTLSAWGPALESDVELGLRFLLLLQQAQVLAEMFEEARTTEMQIEQALSARAAYDIEAATLIHIQNRRAGAVMSPEVAKKRIESAVLFFTRGTGEPRRDELELFRSLTNLSAIEVRLDENKSAYAHAQAAEAIAVGSLDVGHRLDVLASDIVLAGYRSGSVSIDETIERQALIVRSPEGSEDNFIQRCNLAAYLLLGSRDDDAARELQALGEAISARSIDETYLVYYYTALTVAAAALRADTEEALRRHREMDTFVESLRWPYASYIRRRQRLLQDALPNFDSEQTRTSADRILLDTMPLQIGPAWGYYGRLIPCAELSFWSDS